MLATRLLFRKQHENQPTSGQFLAWIAVAIIVVFIGMKFFAWIQDTPRSLLPTDRHFTLLDDLSSLGAIITLPTQTFEAELYTAGIAPSFDPSTNNSSVVAVYVRDDSRFVELDYLAGVSADTYRSTHIYPTQEIQLDSETTIWIQTIDKRPRCIDYEDDLPNQCEFSRQLIMELPHWLVLINADGTHATDGELIEMARSILMPI
jgi:hypothetical protein